MRLSEIVCISLVASMISVSGLIPVADHRGREFLLSFLQNGYGNGQPYIIVLTEYSTNVSYIDNWTGQKEQFQLRANTSRLVELDDALRYTSTVEARERKTVALYSTSDVSVYVMDYNSYSAEGYMAIPVQLLSTRYFIVSYSESKYFPMILVAALQGKTVVTFNFKIQDGGTCGSSKFVSGDIFSVGLDVQEVVGVFCTRDPTGTFISTSVPVSVLSGHTCAMVPPGVEGVDMLMEMLLPVEAWGYQFVLHGLEGRDSGAVYRIVAAENGTELTTSTGRMLILNAGEFKDIDTLEAGNICLRSSRPILVMMYGKSKQADTNVSDGDAFMAQVPPIDRYLTEYMFNSSVLEGFQSYYARTASSEFAHLDGCQYTAHLAKADPDSLRLDQDGANFGAVVYGFMSASGYGFPLGMVLDIDDCERQPCQNRATCSDAVYSYTCTCLPCFTGVRCETDICEKTAATDNVDNRTLSSKMATSPSLDIATTVDVTGVVTLYSPPSDVPPEETSSSASEYINASPALSTSQSISNEEILTPASSTLSHGDLVNLPLYTTTYYKEFKSSSLLSQSSPLSSLFVTSSSSSTAEATASSSSSASATSSSSSATTLSPSSSSSSAAAAASSSSSSAVAASSFSSAAVASSSSSGAAAVALSPSSSVLSSSSTAALSPLPSSSAVETSSSSSLEASATSLSLTSSVPSISSSWLLSLSLQSSSFSLSSSPSSLKTLLQPKSFHATSSITHSTSSSADITPSPVSPTTRCTCRCRINYTGVNIDEMSEALRKELILPTQNLSSSVRKKISVMDFRPTAAAVGYSAIVMIVVALVIITFPDLISLGQWLGCLVTNTKYRAFTFNLRKD